MSWEAARGFTLFTITVLLSVGPSQVRADSVPVLNVKRTNNRSPIFHVTEDDVEFFMNYTGYTRPEGGGTPGERLFHESIAVKALEMIEEAEETVIMSVFLYDSFYAAEESGLDIVGALQAAFLKKRQTHPDVRIAVILDSSHKAYGRRLSPAERELRANGIDVFYSDLLSGLKRASLLGVREGLGHLTRGINRLTFNKVGELSSAVFSRAKVPARFDGDLLSLESAYNAFLLKANHRKLLVTDVRGEDYEAMITSANPHNASAYHVNTAVTVKGDAARYIHNVLREDIRQSASLGWRYAHWCDDADKEWKRRFFTKRFPELELNAQVSARVTTNGQVGVVFVSEREIPDAVVEMLNRAGPDDEIRIQMFYLSYEPILDAIVGASKRTGSPVRLLLDANKDSFNKKKDGTPNRQVARDLLDRSDNIQIRWYSTHGEQNHAKIMTVCNPDTRKFELTTGSCNWTGRNMDGVNMEANVVVSGSLKLCGKFNALFDLLWSNSDGKEYSLDYDCFRNAASRWKWKRGEKPYYWSTF